VRAPKMRLFTGAGIVAWRFGSCFLDNPHQRQTPLRLYLVEDSPILRKAIIRTAFETGRTKLVGAADTEQQAVEGIRKTAPDVVILDLRLREGNGIGVLRKIRSLPRPRPPVRIVLTNYALPEYQRECEALGADYFLDKTADGDQLIDILAHRIQ
jgi:CheY-like chemotaxis protein